MPNHSKRDRWVAFAIGDIWAQAQFASIAYSHLDPKAEAKNDALFSSVHSFVCHTANISKQLRATFNKDEVGTIGDVLGVPKTSLIHDRRLRNYFEHYEQRLRDWTISKPEGITVGDFNIGPKNLIPGNVQFHARNYDPYTDRFTFGDDEVNLYPISEEAKRIQDLAHDWTEAMKRGSVGSPFLSPSFTSTDHQRFYRLALSNHDWQKCRRTLDACARTKDESAKESLLLMAIIYYARPFSGNERNPGAIAASRVDPRVVDGLTVDERKLHDRLMELRNKAVAHAESDTYHAIGHEPNGILASAVFSPWAYIQEDELRPIYALAEKLWSKGDLMAAELRRTIEKK